VQRTGRSSARAACRASSASSPSPPQRGGRSRPRAPVARKPRPPTLSKLGVRDRTRAVLKASELQRV
jgi:hypothetical protein